MKCMEVELVCDSVMDFDICLFVSSKPGKCQCNLRPEFQLDAELLDCVMVAPNRQAPRHATWLDISPRIKVEACYIIIVYNSKTVKNIQLSQT